MNLLEQNIYFSRHYDLSNSLQKNIRTTNTYSTLFDSSNKEYVWNINMAKKFTVNGWLTPIIQGYVGIEEQQMLGRKFKIVLISRRNHRRVGTRFNSRGIDKEGCVSNMVETEQILFYDEHYCSYIQVRGSVPLYWNQKGVFSKIKLKRTPEENYLAATKHFDELIKSYRAILIFDLLSDKRQGEATLMKVYEEVVEEYQKATGANIKYCNIDFHRETAVSVVNHNRKEI